jgi:hypothetical protein
MRAILQVICLLDPDGVPEGLLIDKLGEVKLQDYPQTMGEYYDARLELLSSSLPDTYDSCPPAHRNLPSQSRLEGGKILCNPKFNSQRWKGFLFENNVPVLETIFQQNILPEEAR